MVYGLGSFSLDLLSYCWVYGGTLEYVLCLVWRVWCGYFGLFVGCFGCSLCCWLVGGVGGLLFDFWFELVVVGVLVADCFLCWLCSPVGLLLSFRSCCASCL